jgi:hypothetical protein
MLWFAAHADSVDLHMLTDKDAQHIASELRSRRSAAGKRNLKASKPLKVLPRTTTADTTSEDTDVKRAALKQTLQVLELLPANSAYAKHRRAIIQKALDLLDAERCFWRRLLLRSDSLWTVSKYNRLVVFRSATQDSELEELLKRLDINWLLVFCQLPHRQTAPAC